MAKPGAPNLALIVMLAVGSATAMVTQLGLGPVKAVAPVALALAAIWALSSAAIARLTGRLALLSIPALAAFVFSIVVLVLVLGGHRRYAPFAMANAALSAVLVGAAIRFDRRPRP